MKNLKKACLNITTEETKQFINSRWPAPSDGSDVPQIPYTFSRKSLILYDYSRSYPQGPIIGELPEMGQHKELYQINMCQP